LDILANLMKEAWLNEYLINDHFRNKKLRVLSKDA
jgi:hypothetical protein